MKNLSLVLLAAVALVSAGFAWRQRAELDALRAAAASDDRAALQRRAAAAEKRAQDLAAELAAARAKSAEPRTATAAKADAPKAMTEVAEKAPNVRSLMANATNLMNRPEVQRMMAMSQKAALDGSHSTLFKQLALAPEKLEQLKKLMVERQTVGSDVLAAAVQQGLDPVQNRAEIRKLSADAQTKVDSEIKSLLGDGDYSRYQNYQTTLPQRNVANQLAQSLSYTANPLSDTQAEQLVQILAANPVPRAVPATAAAGGAAPTAATATRTMVFTDAGGAASMGADFVAPAVAGGRLGIVGLPISDTAVQASRSVLNDPQVAALQQMQQQQAQMREMMQAPGGMVMPMGSGIIRMETTTTTGPAHPPAAGAKPPGGE